MNKPIVAYKVQRIWDTRDARVCVPTKRVSNNTPRKNASEGLTCDI